MSINSEIEKFDKNYDIKEKEILILTDGSLVSCGRAGGDKLWNASQGFLAYVDLETMELRNGKGRIVWLLTENEREDRESWSGLFKKETIYHLKVKERLEKFIPEGDTTYFYNDFSLVEILDEDVENSNLEGVLEEYRKPITFNYPSVGEFEFDKDLDFFEGYINWGECEGYAYLENIDMDDENTWNEAAENLKEILDNLEVKDQEFKEFAAKKLVDLANEWNEEENIKITEKDFIERISFSSIVVDLDGSIIVYYNDDDLFWGHIIAVYGDENGVLKEANMEG